MSTEYKPYEFSFKDRATGKAHRWLRYGPDMEACLALAKEAAIYEYPKAGCFLIYAAPVKET